jgi:hypothetical protein
MLISSSLYENLHKPRHVNRKVNAHRRRGLDFLCFEGRITEVDPVILAHLNAPGRPRNGVAESFLKTIKNPAKFGGIEIIYPVFSL